MTSHPSQRPVSALRARMIEDMRVRGFTEKTRNDYVRHVRAFAAFIGRSPDSATAEDLRRFQLHQTQIGMQPPSINSAVAALRFFFTVTLDRPDLARRLTIVREPRRLPAVLSVEEVTLLLQAAPGPKYKAALATGGACPGESRGRRTARLRGRRAEGRRHRFQAHAAAGRARQRPQGSQRHVVAAAAASAARLVVGGPAPGRSAAARLAVSRPQSDRTALDPAAQPRRPCRRRGRRDQEASVTAHAAAQLRHTPVGTGHRHPRHPEPAPAKAGVLLGHAKLDTTALYTRVANTTIRNVTSPLDRLAPLPVGRPRRGA
jgi:integrase/recombinase XerD